MRSVVVTALFAFGALAVAAPLAADPRFDAVERLPGKSSSEALAVSANGCIVAGRSDDQAFVWQAGRVSPGPGQVFNGITPEGGVMVGVSNGRAFRYGAHPDLYLRDDDPPSQAFAVSADAKLLAGSMRALTGGYDVPFYWRQQSNEAVQLPPPPGRSPEGAVLAVSADGSRLAGRVASEAVIWNRADGTLRSLGTLPGHAESEVRGLSADAGIAVGSSGSGPGARAFRWDGATLQDLGPLTTVARATTADGSRVVGEGSEGAFIWDAGHGARLLADALRDDYGLDLAGWQLLAATAIAPDGQAIVGRGIDPAGLAVGWRARLRSDLCPRPPIDLLWSQRSAVELPSRLAVDSGRHVYVDGRQSRNVVRIGADPQDLTPHLVPDIGTFTSPPVEEVLDLAADGDPGDTSDVPFVLGVTADDGVYVSAYGRRQLLELAPDGTTRVIFDGSGYPLLESTSTGPLPTAVLDLAARGDGTLFAASTARLLRIDPDGSVVELMDALQLTRAVNPWADEPLALISRVVLQSGRLLVSDGSNVLVVSPKSGEVLEVLEGGSAFGVSTIRGLAADGRGGAWIWGYGLGHLAADGSATPVFPDWDAEAGHGLTSSFIRSLVADEDGGIYYSDGFSLVHRSAEGVVARVLSGVMSPDEAGRPGLGPFAGLEVADGVIYWIAGPDHVFRYEPMSTTACSNGLDDDGDGLTDWPADPACASRGGSREATECDDGIDNDGDGAIDWDGAGVGPPDPECAGDPLRVIEHPMYCGLGFEVAIVVLPLTQAARAARRRRAARRGDPGLVF